MNQMTSTSLDRAQEALEHRADKILSRTLTKIPSTITNAEEAAGYYPQQSHQGHATEHDPHGIDAHVPGAKLDAGKNQLGLIFHGFSRALQAVGEVGTYGAQKYSPNGWLYVPDGERRYTDAMYRHLMKEAQGERIDPVLALEGFEILHAAQSAWNALARLELMLRNEEKI